MGFVDIRNALGDDDGGGVSLEHDGDVDVRGRADDN